MFFSPLSDFSFRLICCHYHEQPKCVLWFPRNEPRIPCQKKSDQFILCVLWRAVNLELLNSVGKQEHLSGLQKKLKDREAIYKQLHKCVSLNNYDFQYGAANLFVTVKGEVKGLYSVILTILPIAVRWNQIGYQIVGLCNEWQICCFFFHLICFYSMLC